MKNQGISVTSHGIPPGQSVRFEDCDWQKAVQLSIWQVPTRDILRPVLNVKGQSLHF